MPVTTPLSYCDQRFIRPHLHRSAAEEGIHTALIRNTVITITGFSNLKSIQGLLGFNALDADSGIRTPARELPAYWFSRPAPSSAWVSLQIILHLHLDFNFIVTILYDSIENLSSEILNKFKLRTV